MNSCKQCHASLGDYLDGTLSATQREEVEAQLKFCPDCARELRELQAVRATLQDMTPVAAPAQLRSNVRAALQREAVARQQSHRQPENGPWKWRPRQLAWTGTLTFAAIALLILARPYSSTLPPALAPSPGGVDVAPPENGVENKSLESKSGIQEPRSGKASPSGLKAARPIQRPATSAHVAPPSAVARRENITPTLPQTAPQRQSAAAFPPPRLPLAEPPKI